MASSSACSFWEAHIIETYPDSICCSGIISGIIGRQILFWNVNLKNQKLKGAKDPKGLTTLNIGTFLPFI